MSLVFPKDGEAGDIGFIVDAAGCKQVDNSGCLDPTVAAKQLKNKTVQENKPLDARSSLLTEPSMRGAPLLLTFKICGQADSNSSCLAKGMS
jgi:hypothetical protein